MSGIKSNKLTLWDETDATKKFEFKVDGSASFMSYYKEGASGLPADRTFYEVSAPKMSIDGIGDVKSYTQATRNKADTNESGLAQEIVDRGVATAIVQSNVDDEKAARIAGDLASNNSIGIEQAARIAADSAQSATHDAYVASNNAALAAEISRAQTAEGVNSASAAANAVSISNEQNRAQTAEAVNAQAIVDEKTRAQGEEGNLNTAITNEAARAAAAEASLQGQISNLLSNTDAVSLNSLSELVSAYTAGDQGLNSRLVQIESQLAALLEFHN